MITVKIDPKKKHRISPYLYMQFMEPLSVTDTSVDAAWDFCKRDWFPSVVDKVRDLSPTMIRFGGCFASYYHWKEAIGKYEDRKPMVNYAWSGIYQNHVGTHEIVDFCRRVGAEPFLVANMESEGMKHWAYPEGDIPRLGTAEEAAEWVDYCNNPNNAHRIDNGIETPYNVKYWQVGNETSYGAFTYNGHYERGFTCDECYETTARFAEKMKKKDPTITLIGWGDLERTRGSRSGEPWAKKMNALNDIDLLAFHHHFDSGLDNSPLRGTDYRHDAENTWMHLMNAYKSLQSTIDLMRSCCGGKRLAMTEGHFALPGRNRNEVLSSWGAGVAYARCLNVIMRNSDILDIATMADFFGNVWQVNALMIPTPIWQGKPYLQPVGVVMKLFGKNQGEYALDISYSGSVDAVGSVTGNVYYVHIANTDMNASQEIELDLGGLKIESATMHYVAQKPTVEITPSSLDVFDERRLDLKSNKVTLPPAAVAAIEIKVAETDR